MKRVRTTFGHEIYVSAESPSKLRLTAGRDNLKFIDCIHTIRDSTQAGRIIIGRQAVHNEAIRKIPSGC